jgi:hypothetical protein
MANGRVPGNSDIIIIIITVIGTLNSIPGIPQITPHITKERKTTSGLIFKERPINRGSTRFPIINWMAPTIARTNIPGVNSPNCRTEKIAGNKVAISEPMVGIKFKTKMRKDQNNGASIPIATRTK